MRCSRCGNENPDGNRFCGMCGAALLSAPPVAASSPQRPASSGPAIPSAPASRPQTVEAPRSAAAPQSQPSPSPSISGPSFLGLNDRSPQRRTRGSLSIDPHSSTNVDYLLDDDDEPRHFGAGKVLLILIALGLAVGFGYLRWKNQGLSWLNVALHKPAAAVQNHPATDSNAPDSNASDGNAPASPSITPDTQPAPSNAPAAAAQPSNAQPSGAPQSSGTQPAATSAPNGNPPAAAAPTTSAPASTSANNAAPSGDAATSPAKAAAKPSDDSPAANPPSDSGTSSKGNAPASAPPKPAPKPRAARPAAPEPSVDPVAEAHPYLYGRGSSQDCDRGLRILKPAANAGNPKAMIEMGALYSAGLCTPHDLPTAYRWFALALRKDPSNDQVQTDLQKLWSEMTQPERQLAIKLSQ